MLTLAKKIQHLVDLIVIKSPSHDEEELARLNHYVWVSFMMLPITFITGVYNASIHNYLLAFIVTFFSAYLVSSLFLISKTKETYLLYHGANLIFTFLMIYMVYHSNQDISRILWVYTYPLGTIFLFGNRVGFLWSCFLLLVIVLIFLFVPHIQHVYTLAFEVRFCVSYLSIAFITSWIEYHRYRYQQESKQTHQALFLEQVLLKEEIQRRILLEEELQQLAQTDTLTGLHNRRYFLERAEQELLRARRYNFAISFALLDIDYFKHINDTLGHPAGDAVLRALGQYCLGAMRETDIIGRLGGEELAFLLLHTNEEQARQKMDRLRVALSQLDIVYTKNAEPLRITASIGIASLTPDIQTFEELYLLVDKKLYEAKNAGRNCIR